jgi:hypothetical protein
LKNIPSVITEPKKSFAIWTDGWAGFDSKEPVPVEAIVPADLSDWQYAPPLKHIALDRRSRAIRVSLGSGSTAEARRPSDLSLRV